MQGVGSPKGPELGPQRVPVAAGHRLGRWVALRVALAVAPSGQGQSSRGARLAPRHPAQLPPNLVSSCRGRLW